MDLPTNDSDHVELGNELSKLEKEQIKFITEYWYSKQIDAARDFATKHQNLKVENLYNKKGGKKHRRSSLREIVNLDADLFTTFFPIILTTPDVACNLFRGLNQYFDLVINDENSISTSLEMNLLKFDALIRFGRQQK